MERSELEDQLNVFFDNKSVKNYFNLSRIFIESGYYISDIKTFSDRVQTQVFAEVITMLSAYLEINNLLSEIIKSAGSISELVSAIKSYSHLDQDGGHKAVDVCLTMDSTLKVLDYKLKHKKIIVTKSYQENIPSIQGNAGQLSQVWTHIIDNAIDAVEIKGQINIEINGKGIREEICDKIFDAFFTTKDLGKGVGLGLEISQQIIRAHGGQIEYRPRKNQTEMFILLPL